MKISFKMRFFASLFYEHEYDYQRGSNIFDRLQVSNDIDIAGLCVSLLLLGLSLMAKEKLIQVEPHHRVLEEKSFRKGANVSNLIDMVTMVQT